MTRYVSPADLASWSAQLQTASASIQAVVASMQSETPDQVLAGYLPGDTTVWNETPVFQESFPALAVSGQFPAVYAGSWDVYPQGWHDSSGLGTYDPANLSVVDRPDGYRVLRQQVTKNGTLFGGCVTEPVWGGGIGYIASYRLSYRRKCEQQDNGHDVVLGWPALNSDWPVKSGEPDHTEYNTLNNPTLTGWLHVKGATSGSDHQVHLLSSVPAYDDFHVITIENIAGKSYRRYIDGVLSNVVLTAGQVPAAADAQAVNPVIVLAAGYSVPDEALRICLQLESNGLAPAAATIIDTDWLVVQALAGA